MARHKLTAATVASTVAAAATTTVATLATTTLASTTIAWSDLDVPRLRVFFPVFI